MDMYRTLALAAVTASVLGCAAASTTMDHPVVGEEGSMKVCYLEIVTGEVDAVCTAYAAANDLEFGEPDAVLGNARTAALPGGGLVGVRAPLRESEMPVVRPYWLVEDIASAVAAAEEAGAQIALPPMELPGHGTCAIYIVGGVEHGLWQR
jgi:predicted enzyme related to lactoylglutathione lyase